MSDAASRRIATTDRDPNESVQIFRPTPVGITSQVITASDLNQYERDGWTADDPAFSPHRHITRAAEASNDGLVPIHSNFGGLPKRVNPAEVAWYEQNGWTAGPKPA